MKKICLFIMFALLYANLFADGSSAKLSWDEYIASIEAKGNKLLSEKEYPQKIAELLLKDEEKIVKMARLPDRSRIFYSKDPKGIYWLYKTDKNENVTYSLNSDGIESWSDYDSSGNVLHYRNSDGIEWWQDYDSNGNVIHHSKNDGYEAWGDYDAHGNVILHRWITSDKRSFRETATYDNVKVSKDNTKTRKIYSKTIRDSETTIEIWYTYSKNYNDVDKWDERNFVTQIRFKANGGWSSTINGKRVENISGEGTLRFEILPSGEMKVTPDSGDWWIAE